MLNSIKSADCNDWWHFGMEEAANRLSSARFVPRHRCTDGWRVLPGGSDFKRQEIYSRSRCTPENVINELSKRTSMQSSVPYRLERCKRPQRENVQPFAARKILFALFTRRVKHFTRKSRATSYRACDDRECLCSGTASACCSARGGSR